MVKMNRRAASAGSDVAGSTKCNMIWMCILTILAVERYMSSLNNMENPLAESPLLAMAASSQQAKKPEAAAVSPQKDTSKTSRVVLSGGGSFQKKAFRLEPNYCVDKNMSKTKFDKIYANGGWGAKQRRKPADFYQNGAWPRLKMRSASGGGSDLGYATNTSLLVLRRVIEKFNIKTMIDIPSGDVNWIFDSWETDSLDFYIGMDIVGSVARLNDERFMHHSNKVFRKWDGTMCPLPKIVNLASTDQNPQPVDMIHVRDVIQHMSLHGALQFLCNILTHGSKILVTTTYPGAKCNTFVRPGGFYPNNLYLPPFDLPRSATVSCAMTHPTQEPDYTCVFDLRGSWVQDWIKAKKCYDFMPYTGIFQDLERPACKEGMWWKKKENRTFDMPYPTTP